MLCSSSVVAHGPLGARSVLHSGAQCRISKCLNVQCVWKSQGYHHPQIRSKASQCTVHPNSTNHMVKSLRNRFPIEKPYIVWNFFINCINESADFMTAGMSHAHSGDMRLQGITAVCTGQCCSVMSYQTRVVGCIEMCRHESVLSV
jgi:hypothetical protein